MNAVTTIPFFRYNAVIACQIIAIPVRIRHEICGRIFSLSRDTVESIVNLRLQLAAAHFPQAVGRHKNRTIEKRAFLFQRRHSRQ